MARGPHDTSSKPGHTHAVDDLVGPAEIAARLGLDSAATINQWVLRHDDFPTPVVRLKMGCVYSWKAVLAWHQQRKSRGGRGLPG